MDSEPMLIFSPILKYWLLINLLKEEEKKISGAEVW